MSSVYTAFELARLAATEGIYWQATGSGGEDGNGNLENADNITLEYKTKVDGQWLTDDGKTALYASKTKNGNELRNINNFAVSDSSAYTMGGRGWHSFSERSDSYAYLPPAIVRYTVNPDMTSLGNHVLQDYVKEVFCANGYYISNYSLVPDGIAWKVPSLNSTASSEWASKIPVTITNIFVAQSYRIWCEPSDSNTFGGSYQTIVVTEENWQDENLSINITKTSSNVNIQPNTEYDIKVEATLGSVWGGITDIVTGVQVTTASSDPPEPPPQKQIMNDVIISGVETIYNGDYYAISVYNAPNGSIIEYSDINGIYDSPPSYRDAGTHATEVKITCEGYEDLTGGAAVDIAPRPLNSPSILL